MFSNVGENSNHIPSNTTSIASSRIFESKEQHSNTNARTQVQIQHHPFILNFRFVVSRNSVSFDIKSTNEIDEIEETTKKDILSEEDLDDVIEEEETDEDTKTEEPRKKDKEFKIMKRVSELIEDRQRTV